MTRTVWGLDGHYDIDSAGHMTHWKRDGTQTHYYNIHYDIFQISNISDRITISSEIDRMEREKREERKRQEYWNPSQISRQGRDAKINWGDLSRSAASGKESGCFIATAVYGNESAPEVVMLRRIRDEEFSNSVFGRVLIKAYYSGFGENIARYIKENLPSFIPIIKKGLDYVVRRYDKRKRN
jgi:hypothetical protein